MKQDEIIEMARQAWEESGEGWVVKGWFEDRGKALEAFAKLVAAKERNRIADELQKMPLNDTANSIAIWIRGQE